jgi:hypothetical protein
MDQATIRKNLVKIYADNTIDSITDEKIVSVFFPGDTLSAENIQRRKEELALSAVYLKTKEILAECRKNIEQNVFDGTNMDEEAEVKSVLFKVVMNRAIYFSFKLDETRYAQQMNLLNELINAMFIATNKWSPRVVKHYHFVLPFMKDWYNFFLSYTNKSAFNLNMRFERLLNLNGNVSPKINQVARFIADTLYNTENLPNGFIDEKEIEYGENFKAKINSALAKSFTFIQVISKETFVLQGTNWCQFEYNGCKKFYSELIKSNKAYEDAFTKNIIFLVMSDKIDDVKPAIDFPEYTDWLKDIQETHYITMYASHQNFDQFMKNINELAKTIIALKNNLINAIPE